MDKNDGYEINIDIQDNSDFILKASELQIQRALFKAGENAVRYVVEYMSKPDFTGRDIVDTGRLRASISFATSEHMSNPTEDGVNFKSNKYSTIVGTNVEYASYVELGTKKQPARHFLLNGINNSLSETKNDIEEIMKNG